MPHLNVRISDEAMTAARLAADREGMLLRVWIERLILRYTRASEPEQPRHTERA